LDALPAPRVTLGLESDMNGSGSRLDLSGISFSRKKEAAPGVVFEENGNMKGKMGISCPEVAEQAIPANLLNHPMFRNDENAGAGGTPTARDLHAMRETKFLSIKSTDVQDPDWYLKNMMSGGPGLHAGKTVTDEVSMYEAKTWKETTHADPSKNQKKKHQINWLATEAMEKEAEMLDRAANSRLTKSQTSMKYGW